MMSKFIVDSLCFWASEYKVKGFRFDLMGLIDFKTMLKAATALYKIDRVHAWVVIQQIKDLVRCCYSIASAFELFFISIKLSKYR